MSIKNQWLLNILMVAITWLSLPFLGTRSIKRFLPASIFIVILEALHVQVGKRRKWWVFYNKPDSYLFNEFPFNLGPFLIIALWILKLTYGNFKRFLLLNAATNAFFASPVVFFAKKARYFTLVRLNNLQFFLYFFFKAPLLYGFQYLFEKGNRIPHDIVKMDKSVYPED